MTKATLARTTFNWGWLTGSEVQSILTIGGKHGGLQADTVPEEPRALHLDPKAARRRVSFALSRA